MVLSYMQRRIKPPERVKNAIIVPAKLSFCHIDIQDGYGSQDQ